MPPQPSPAMANLNTPLRMPSQLTNHPEQTQVTPNGLRQPLDPRFIQGMQPGSRNGTNIVEMNPTMLAGIPPEQPQFLADLSPEKRHELVTKWQEQRATQINASNMQAGRPQMPMQANGQMRQQMTQNQRELQREQHRIIAQAQAQIQAQMQARVQANAQAYGKAKTKDNQLTQQQIMLLQQQYRMMVQGQAQAQAQARAQAQMQARAQANAQAAAEAAHASSGLSATKYRCLLTGCKSKDKSWRR
jgi:hypothetical protein